MEKDYMTAKQVSEILLVNEKTVLDWAKKGMISYYKVGSRYRFTQENIDDFIEKKERMN